MQAALIVFGVVVGLALNEWREGRAEAARTERVLDALVGEVEVNRGGVEQAVAYYGDMTEGAIAFEEARGPDAALDLSEIEGYRGDTGPVLLSGTYDAATATGAFLGVDIDLAADLSSTYSLQEAFGEALVENRLTTISTPTPSRAKWRAYTIYQNGEFLLEGYDGALAALRAR